MTDRARALERCLAEYAPNDEVEAAHLARMRELCESIADPFSRASFAPGHFTASAFIVSPEGDDLLLIFHGKLQRWLQPGGHIDATDPDVLAAALREAREEVGIAELTPLGSGPLDIDVHAIPARASEPSHEHFDVRFAFRASSRSFAAGSDAKAARWVPLGELTAELSDASVLRAAEKLRRCTR